VPPPSAADARNRDLDAGFVVDPEKKVVVENPAPHPVDRTGHPVPRFDYDYGGDDWEGYCRTGQRQSPINIVTSNLTKTLDHTSNEGRHFIMNFHYHALPNATLEFNKHSLWIRGNFGFILNGCCEKTRYNVLQLVFHARSEHEIDGSASHDGHFPMELHIVHQKEGSKGKQDLLIVAVLFKAVPRTSNIPQAQQASRFLESIKWSDLSSVVNQPQPLENVDPYGLMRDTLEGAFFAYNGSLTTPTCDETVMWRVMQRLENISERQVDLISDLFRMSNGLNRGNNRKPQPRNGREVVLIN
jgi:carbonic anhydrase